MTPKKEIIKMCQLLNGNEKKEGKTDSASSIVFLQQKRAQR